MKKGLVFICILIGGAALSQNAVRMHFRKFGADRVMEIYPGDKMTFKKKGNHRWMNKKVLAVSDTLLVMNGEEEVKWSEVKCIRIRSTNYVKSGLRKFFARLSILFIGLDTFNNLILLRPTIVNKKAVIVSAALFAAHKIMLRWEYKKVRLKGDEIWIPITTKFTDLANG